MRLLKIFGDSSTEGRERVRHLPEDTQRERRRGRPLCLPSGPVCARRRAATGGRPYKICAAARFSDRNTVDEKGSDRDVPAFMTERSARQAESAWLGV